MPLFITRLLIFLNCAVLFLFVLLVIGHASDSRDVYLGWFFGFAWIALASTWALKLAKTSGLAAIVIALATLPVGLAVGQAVLLLGSVRH